MNNNISIKKTKPIPIIFLGALSIFLFIFSLIKIFFDFIIVNNINIPINLISKNLTIDIILSLFYLLIGIGFLKLKQWLPKLLFLIVLFESTLEILFLLNHNIVLSNQNWLFIYQFFIPLVPHFIFLIIIFVYIWIKKEIFIN